MKAGELKHFHNFLTLAQELHFGRAAEKSFITQPALSQQIARLENSLGVQLFVRDQRQLALTPAGMVFRDGISQIIRDFEQLTRRTLDAAGVEDLALSIGLIEYASLPFLSTAMTLLQNAYPAVKVARHEISCVMHGAALARGQIDIGLGVILDEPQPAMPAAAEIKSKFLAISQWRLLMPAGHRLAGAGRLSLACLATEPIIMFSRDVNAPVHDGLMRACREAGVKPNIVFETTQAHFGIQLAREGMGLMLGTSYVLGAPQIGMVTVPLDGFLPLAIVANWRDDESRPLIHSFLKILVEEGLRCADPALAPPMEITRAA